MSCNQVNLAKGAHSNAIDVEVSKKTCTQKAKKILQHVTLEPMLLLKMFAESNARIVALSLETERVCRINLNYTAEECAAIDDGNHTHIQGAVQVYQNTFNYYQNLIDSLLPVFITMFAGSLSDTHGRKLPMIIVLLGFVMYAAIYTATALNPSWPVEVLYAATAAVDITGSWVVFNMAVYSYLADITPGTKRTKRMGYTDAIWYLGGPIGTWFGGWLYQSFGYVIVFSVSGGIWLACVLYVWVFVEESVSPEESATVVEKKNCHHHVVELGQTALRRYVNRGRFHLFSLMAIKLGLFLTQGHQVYLWARRVLGWDTMQYSIWMGANDALHQIGMLVLVAFASSHNISDHAVAMLGLISAGLWSATLACVQEPAQWWLVILATCSGVVLASSQPAIRSLITNIADKKDVGKVLALLGLLESLWLSVDRTLFTLVYNACVETFPQINFVIQSCMTVPLVLGLIFLKREWNKRSKDADLTP